MCRRRGELTESLQFLEEAAQLEVRIADGTITSVLSEELNQEISKEENKHHLYANGTAMASPSTYLNLCTIHNEMGNHEAAVIAVELSIAGLQRELAEETEEEARQHTAMMLAVGLYNLGVSLERRNRHGDAESAQQAYLLCLQTARQYLVDPRCPTVDAAVEAIRRMRGTKPRKSHKKEDTSADRVLAARTPFAWAQADADRVTEVDRPLFQADSGATSPSHSKTWSNTAPQRLASLPITPAAPMSPAPFRRPSTASLVASGNSPLQGSRRDSNRLPSLRPSTASQRFSSSDRSSFPPPAQKRAASGTKRRPAPPAGKSTSKRPHAGKPPKANSKVANRLRQRMSQDMMTHEARIENTAATTIQRTWRGVLARDTIRRQMAAAVTIQRCFRVFSERRRRQREKEREEEERLAVLRRAVEDEAARVIQARARQYLKRRAIHQAYLDRQQRRHLAARRIQRQFRVFNAEKERIRQEKRRAAKRAEQQQQFRLNYAARRIQQCYHDYKEACVRRAAIEEEWRRHNAAVVLQSHMRGHLTRSWYSYFKPLRRQEMLRDAANKGNITIVQVFLRAMASQQEMVRRCQEFAKGTLEDMYEDAAICIQCHWRSHVARIRYERLRAEREVKRRHALRIFRWYKMRKERNAFLQHREQRRRDRAARQIQTFYKKQKEVEKQKAFEQYHQEQLAKAQFRRLQEQYTPYIQAFLLARRSSALVGSVAADWFKRTTAAVCWQRVGRGYLARKDLSELQVATETVLTQERNTKEQTEAALVLQRAWRCAAAKACVEERRRQKAAVKRIERQYKVYQAKRELHDLKAAKEAKRQDAAARVIQSAWGVKRKQKQLAEMRAYYDAVHEKKMEKARRTVAATSIQSVWRGYKDRQYYHGIYAAYMRRVEAATVIQRAWRARQHREEFVEEVASRAALRNYQHRAALTIQCFWRKMAAAEKVLQLRQVAQHRHNSARHVQSWWRRVLAQKELQRRRTLRQEEEEAMAAVALLWARASTVVQAHLRAHLAARYAMQRRRDKAFGELTLLQRVAFTQQTQAAIKIQAVYRGHYDRVWVRGMKREIQLEEERIAQEKERERKAAVTIQSMVRRWRARRAVEARRQQKLEEMLESREAYLLSADPTSVVRELFWIRDAVEKRDTSAERLERLIRQQAAAATIQQAYRTYLSRKEKSTIQKHQREQKAVRLILQYYRRYRLRKSMEGQFEREAAAITIQRYLRGWQVRRSWQLYKESAQREKEARLYRQDLEDCAALMIQCAWRQRVARKEAQRRRETLAAEKEAQAREEAAVVIQRAFRAYLQRKKEREASSA
ncbi:IQ calmodulin-binding motif containing protein, putative [Angomonas deanei]|uniref:IQ calmodulin-binding motif containing protein, putative n=1 Tax=Angomonas deanei TaxID=59799 RepID=A0A7G2CPY4_9TRYP|nr:IQ calmodulin-binding motif containing protein, putative [Angomonas deanei]